MCTQKYQAPPREHRDPDEGLTREQLIERNRKLAAKRALDEGERLAYCCMPTDPTGLNPKNLAKRANSYTTN